MASKRRNMFQKNKTQETTENVKGSHVLENRKILPSFQIHHQHHKLFFKNKKVEKKRVAIHVTETGYELAARRQNQLPPYDWAISKTAFLPVDPGPVKKNADWDFLLAQPKVGLRLINKARSEEVHDFYRLCQLHRDWYRDSSGSVYPLAMFKRHAETPTPIRLEDKPVHCTWVQPCLVSRVAKLRRGRALHCLYYIEDIL
ncbi:hypothetical protein AAG570_000224 [Ranatra chinensis]|uniref:Uncharacterized protein n=1 Tax=Ranatra chinensis TaxID=642074 RepID=A0ABD0Z6W7_9HEMI